MESYGERIEEKEGQLEGAPLSFLMSGEVKIPPSACIASPRRARNRLSTVDALIDPRVGRDAARSASSPAQRWYTLRTCILSPLVGTTPELPNDDRLAVPEILLNEVAIGRFGSYTILVKRIGFLSKRTCIDAQNTSQISQISSPFTKSVCEPPIG